MKKADPKKPATREMLDQAVDAILKGMDEIIGALKDEMSLRFKAVGAHFDRVDGRLDDLEMGQRHIKNEIKGLKVELSDTPSRGEFEDLKSRVDKYHPKSRSL